MASAEALKDLLHGGGIFGYYVLTIVVPFVAHICCSVAWVFPRQRGLFLGSASYHIGSRDIGALLQFRSFFRI
jgi:hypothetical protein